MTDTTAPPSATVRTVAPTAFQQAVLRFRGHCNIMNAGGRGSGKSFGMLLHCLDHCRALGPEARPLVLREQWNALTELGLELLEMATAAFGRGVRRNKAEGTLSLPNGAVVTFSNVSDENSYARHQGRSYSALFADEIGNFPPSAFRFVQLVRSNLRVPPGHRVEIHCTANPHGRSHTRIFKEYVSKAPPWHPFLGDEGDWWIWTTSDLTMNPHIDQLAYRRQLLAASGHDAALADAWIHGRWDVLGGVMFDVFDPAVHVVRRPPYLDARYLIGADWGTASPAAALLLARLKAPIGDRFRQGDVIVLDETDTALPTDLSEGTGAGVHTWAEMLTEMGARNGRRRPEVVTDDARGLAGDTVVSELLACGLSARRPHAKDRVGTWALVRTMLQAAVDGADRPALWLTSGCPHLLETLPEAPRGQLRPEDIDPKWPRDHWLDALGYGLRELMQRGVTFGRIKRTY